jgi:hypothetical protein
MRARVAQLPPRAAGDARLAFVGYSNNLSSIAAFARTLEVHLKGLDRRAVTAIAAEAFVQGGTELEDEPAEEHTRRWLQKRLAEMLDDLAPDEHIAAFTGSTPLDCREELSAVSTPIQHKIRCILICTDAAREGINLQSRCHDLIEVDLPWNPARLEQRNGRIDHRQSKDTRPWAKAAVLSRKSIDSRARKRHFPPGSPAAR